MVNGKLLDAMKNALFLISNDERISSAPARLRQRAGFVSFLPMKKEASTSNL